MNKGMNIAYLSLEYPPLVYGGLGVYVDAISKELSSLGNKISVYALGNSNTKKRESKKGVTAHRLIPTPMGDTLELFYSQKTMSWGQGLVYLNDLLSYNQLAAAGIKDNGPYDICVAHDWLGLPGGLAVRNEIPLIYHVHGLEIGRSDYPNPQIVELERKGATLSDAVLTVSNAMKEEVASLGVDPAKIHVCHHGIDCNVFNADKVSPETLTALRKRYGIESGDEVILFLGRLEPVKGVMQLMNAMRYVRKVHPNAKLILIGKGTLEDQVRREAQSLGGIVLVSDFITLNEKIDFYALADVCVFPSLYEPFGIVALEAAAMGKAAVIGASGISGLREIVENPSSDKPTGVHVDPRKPEDIAWGILTALEDKDRLVAWGDNARTRCQNLFTWQRAAELTLEIYKEVAASRS